MEKKLIELTNPQKSIWSMEQYFKYTTINNICGTVRIKEKVNFDVLKNAINIFIKENDSFRIHILIDSNNEAKQYFSTISDLKLDIIETNSDKELNQLEKQLVSLPFSIIDNDLYKIVLFKMPDGSGGFITLAHHLIADSWTSGIIANNIMEYYYDLLKGTELKIQSSTYKEYIEAEKDYYLSDRYEKDKKYWESLYYTIPDSVSIPYSNISKDNLCVANRVKSKINKKIVDKIKNYCNNNKISVYNFMMAIYSIYIGNVANVNEFVIGTPILNRLNYIEKNTTGMYVSNIPLKINIDSKQLILDFMRSISVQTLQSMRHQRYPYQDLLKYLREKDSSVPNLYNVVLSYQITKTDKMNLPYDCYWTFNKCSSDDIQIHIADYSDSGNLDIMYDFQSNKYSKEYVNELHERILNIIDQVINKNIKNISDIEIVTLDEKQKLLYEFNNTDMLYPNKTSIVELFEKQVEVNPNNIAVKCNGETITYGELNKKANQLSHYLIYNNITLKSICLVMNKSIDYIVAMLGILKSNNYIVPISVSYPKDRINYMIENSDAPLVITKNTFLNLVKDKNKILNLNEINLEEEDIINPNLNIFPDSISYIIYTSGSTGKPKGVMISHKALINHIYSINDRFNNSITKLDQCLSIANLSFDACMQEIFVPLLNGATLHLLEDDCIYNPKKVSDYIFLKKITFAFIPPTILDTISLYLSTRKRVALNKLLVGVQGIYNTTINNLLSLNKHMQIHNGYGPTEATICCISNMFTSKIDGEKAIIPIGTPMGNCKAYIINKFDNIQPIGIIGELCLSGDCLSNGYLNLSEETRKKFLKIKSVNNFVYKTGDLAYYLPNGEIQFVGRVDSQLKIHGYRIELGEINNIVNSCNDIREAYTVVSKDKKLFTFVIGEKETDIKNLKTTLKQKLPYYMIPNKIFVIDEFPINANGKTDNKALLEYASNATKNDNFLEATTNFEKSIEKILILILGLDVEKLNFNESFLEIGGDSLSAIEFSMNILTTYDKEITVKDMFNINSLKELCEYIQKKEIVKNNFKIQPVKNENNIYELSTAEKRIFFANQMIGNNSIVYNTPGAILVNSILDKYRVRNAFNKIVNKNSIFRTKFIIDESTVKQQIVDNVTLNIKFGEEKEKNIDKLLSKFTEPFDLEKAPILKIYVYYLDNKKTLILLDSHHIITDGVSLNIFIKEFFDSYNGKDLDNTEIDYKDYSVWEQKNLNNEMYENGKKYWVNRFKDFDFESLNLPYDYTLSPNRTYVGNKLKYNADSNIFEKAEEIAKEMNISTYTVFLASLFITLYKYTGQTDIVVGSPVANRVFKEVQNVIGNFVNNIAIRNTIKSNQTIKDYLIYLNTLVSEDLSYQYYPFDMLVKDLHVATDNSKNPIFDVVFTYQSQTNKLEMPNIVTNQLEINNHISKFNMTIEVVPNTRNINIEYRTDLFKEETINSFIEHYQYVLEQLLNNIESLIDNINIITPKEKVLIEHFNNTYGELNGKYVSQIFEEQVEKHPNDIAVICEDKTLTYRELNNHANSLANYLIKKGVKPSNIVAIISNRSLETIVCMMAILKAGAAFLNIDPTYPTERTEYYIRNSNIEFILIQKELKNKIDNIENCIEMDLTNTEIYEKNIENPKVDIKDTDLSYIIYTSGSTGKPKGVKLNQLGLTNMVQAMTKVLKYLQDGNKHCIASVTSTPFDIFVYEIIVSLTHGLKVAMANNAEHRNPKLLDKLIRKYNVDVMTVTPSLMKINYDNREPNTALANVKNMVFGGEPLPEKFVQDLRALADDIKIYNIYGPSEITVLSNVQDLDGENEITVGPPILNTQEYVLDKDMKQVPIGVIGEIYIAGIQVGDGYIGREDLTSERFLPNPFGPGKIYKSGDIGRWTFDGKIQCLGRNDNQVKLRGLRIELGEIEDVIMKMDSVTSAVVQKVELNNNEALCAYYVSTSKISEQKVRDELRKFLPAYMVPTYIIKLNEMPYTINRKIDRKALPLPEFEKTKEKNNNIDKFDSNEEKLTKIWKELLNVNDITIDDNFFDIGGDSILAIKMQIEALKYGIQFEYADIFAFPTIRQLSKKIPVKEIEEFNAMDFTKINELLNSNATNKIEVEVKYKFNNILLIGSTGYLGAHIANEFLTSKEGILYCLVRNKNYEEIKVRLKNILDFYFGKGYFEKYSNRIKLINGDISCDNLNLSEEDENILNNNIEAVINSGALVKHYGILEDFEKINVQGTQNIINFCKKYNKRLIHISTISVSGFGEKGEIAELPEEEGSKTYSENDIYINQNLRGVYAITKLKAEIAVLNAIIEGLDAQILRMGNITNRYSDGVFQKNIEDNAFVKRIKSFIEIGAIPEFFLDHFVELTPVDLAAQATIKILEYSSKYYIFHIYNPNLISIREIVETIKNRGYSIIPVNNKLMTNIITGILENDSEKQKIEGLIQDLTQDKSFNYSSKIRLTSDLTTKYLEKIKFNWPIYDERYINKCFEYYELVNYINKKG